jgi:hypothetical protein
MREVLFINEINVTELCLLSSHQKAVILVYGRMRWEIDSIGKHAYREKMAKMWVSFFSPLKHFNLI